MDKNKALKQLRLLEINGGNMRLAAEGWKNDYQKLFSTILSARTMDETTIPVSIELFKKYPNTKKLSKASYLQVSKIIKRVNFYKNKTKNIISCAKSVEENYKGKIPRDFDKLIELPGVGRKTANVFLSEIGKDEIGIDTHVNYISHYLNWTKSKKIEDIENDLKNLFPKSKWKRVNSILVRFGKNHTSRKKKNEILDEIKNN